MTSGKSVFRVTEEDGQRKKVMSLGQHGGDRGSRWEDGVFSSIKQVVIYHGECVDSIQTEYDDNGSSIWSLKHGANGGQRSETVLEYPNEYLISIHGYMGYWRDDYVIRSLSLVSNTQIYGPFGREDGTKFWFPTTGAKIVGFHGRSGLFLDSIGLYAVPIQDQR